MRSKGISSRGIRIVFTSATLALLCFLLVVSLSLRNNSKSTNYEVSQYEDRVLHPHLNPDGFEAELSRLQFNGWLHGERWDSDDPVLAEGVKKTLLVSPSDGDYCLSNPDGTGWIKSSESPVSMQIFKSLLATTKNGFFIECGAHDGESESDTLWLEKEMNWMGLLIEADPNVFKKLISKKRKAWLANVALTGNNRPQEVTFYRSLIDSHAGGLIYDPVAGATVAMQSYSIPLFTILLALNRTVVDYMSLDVEGDEYIVLKAIPFDQILFRVISVDYAAMEEGKKKLVEFMQEKGFRIYMETERKKSKFAVFVNRAAVSNNL